MIRRRALAPLTVAAALMLSACGITMTPTDAPTGSATPSAAASGTATPLTELEILADPHAYQGPSTATLAIPGLQAPAQAPAIALPVTVTSHDRDGDTEVTVTDASRVVAVDMAGSIADTIWALGLDDALVGRDIASSFPGSEDIPVVTGNGHSVNAEAILALEPTLVISDGSVGPREAIEQLRDVGVTVVFVENDSSFEGAATLARDVATALGAPDAGAELASQLTAGVDEVRSQIEQIRPDGEPLRMVFLYLRGTAGVYYLFGAETGADDLITALGGVDVSEELGITGTRPLTDEAMLAADPDLLLVMTNGLDSVGGVDGLVEAWPAIGLTQAGQNRRVVDMADTQILSFGPRSAAVLDALARAIYAPDAE